MRRFVVITWHRVLRPGLDSLTLRGAAARGGGGGGGDRGEGLVTGAGGAGGARVVTEHHSPHGLGRDGVPAGADTLAPRSSKGASPGGVGRFLEQIDGFLKGF